MNEKELFKYWIYFKIIEKDFRNLSETIEIDKDHFPVYSRELIKLLVVTCSEVDTLFRVLRDINNPGDGGRDLTIQDHREFVDENHNFLLTQDINISHSGIVLTPFAGWTNERVPDWWTAYNRIKHHRNTDYKLANLEHCLNAGAALVSLLLTAQTTIAESRLPMDPDIRLEFFGVEFNYSVVRSNDGQNFNGK